jgi:hypothetical protein
VTTLRDELVPDDVWERLDLRGAGVSDRERRLAWVAAPVAAVILLLTLLQAHAKPAGPHLVGAEDRRQLTCCRADDIDPVRRAGDTLRLHWTVINGLGETVDGPVTIEEPTVLTARLSGPYSDVMQLKSAVGGPGRPAATYEAASLSLAPGVVSAAGPVSEIRLPRDAGAGYYELDTSVVTGGMTASGGSIIQVAAAK